MDAVLKGNSTNCKKPFVAPLGAQSQLPQVMSLESALVGAEDYKLENERRGVESERSELTGTL